MATLHMHHHLHIQFKSDLRSAFHLASSTFHPFSAVSPSPPRHRALARAFSTDPPLTLPEKPPICTADELHYVSLPNSDWRLALWRYHPPPQAPRKNHPLLLLSGVGTNAIGYDLSPGCSFARFMSGEGFDTWVLEVRGAGLSVQASNLKEIKESATERSEQMGAVADGAASVMKGEISNEMENSNDFVSKQNNAAVAEVTNGAPSPKQQLAAVSDASSDSHMSTLMEESMRISTVWDESKLVTTLTETFMRLSERLSGFLNEGQSKIISGKFFDQVTRLLEDSQLSDRVNEIRAKLSSLLETQQNSAIASQIRDLSQRLVNIFDEGQRTVSPQLFDLQERLSSTVEDFQKQIELIIKYDWDFDKYLDEDVPTAMEYIRKSCRPLDGKLLAIGHSMGGILLYARLSQYAFEGKDPGLAAIVTLASSLDYTSSRSTLKLLLPLADPAQALNVPAVPLGALLSAAYPLSSRPPYALSWLNQLISAEDMMHPELLEKLILNNFCTVPAKVILQLTTAFREGGLCDRNGKFFYKDYLHKNTVPVLAIAGDQDGICPPEAVEETVKLFPENVVTYKVFGEPQGPHYAHYDLVGGRLAVEQVYPCIIEFLNDHDSFKHDSFKHDS